MNKHNDTRPITVERDWDRFYKEFPDVYDRFALSSVNAIDILHDMFGLNDKLVLDVGSGTGRSTLEIAKRARYVVGVEPWDEMRGHAINEARSQEVKNVDFVKASAETLPIGERSVDLIVSVWGFPFWFALVGERGWKPAKAFVEDALNALRPGGTLVAVGGTPEHFAGSLTSILFPGDSDMLRDNKAMDSMMIELGFAFNDFDTRVDYQSVQEAVETYGFIYGSAAIDYLKSNNISSLGWKIRIYFRSLE